MDRANVSGSCADDNCMATRTTATTIGTRITLVSLLFGRWTRGTDFHIERITQSLHEIRSRALAPHAHEDGLREATALYARCGSRCRASTCRTVRRQA